MYLASFFIFIITTKCTVNITQLYITTMSVYVIHM